MMTAMNKNIVILEKLHSWFLFDEIYFRVKSYIITYIFNLDKNICKSISQSINWLGSCGAFGGWGVLPGCGSPQSPRMPEKLTPSQVGTLSTWSTGCDGLSARRLGGSQCEGWVDLG